MNRRSALISGAGVAGPVLAFWLGEAGWDVTVVECASELRTGGCSVDLLGMAIDVMRRMGLHEKVLALRHEPVPIALLSQCGFDSGTVEFTRPDDDAGRAVIEIDRGALATILHRASRETARYVFGDSITSLRQKDSGVEVTFEVSPTHTFDAVIGADGIHSDVRRHIFGDESQFIQHLGACVAIWDLPNTETRSAGTGFIYSHRGRSIMVERPVDGAVTRAFLTFGHPYPGALNLHDTAEIVVTARRAFAEDRWGSDEIIDTMSTADDLYVDTVSQIWMDCWSAGRVALVGDAAYAPALLSGHGPSDAIVGAYLLAEELANADRPESAFAAYERRVRSYLRHARAADVRA